MAGRLSTLDVDNSFDTSIKPSYKNRTVQELFDSGEIKEQYFDVRVDGFYIETSDTSSEQRTKIGRPMLLDVETGLRIPLIGRKLKDVTFGGTAIGKESQLYEVIDMLDKTGEVSFDSKRADGTRIIANIEDVAALGHFLKELLYRGQDKRDSAYPQSFLISVSPDRTTIFLKRNDENIRANSLWDAEINFIVKKDLRTSSVNIPFTSREGEGDMSYFDFLNENFYTGAAKAVIGKMIRDLQK